MLFLRSARHETGASLCTLCALQKDMPHSPGNVISLMSGDHRTSGVQDS